MTREDRCCGWVVLVVTLGAGHILSVTGQSCSSHTVTPVKVCTDTVWTGSRTFLDFDDAKDHLPCTCSVTFTNNGMLQVTNVVYPNYEGCGSRIEFVLTTTFSFGCKTSGGSNVNVLPSDVMSIQIDKTLHSTTWDTNYCVVVSSDNGFNFSVSCKGNGSATAATVIPTTTTTTAKLPSATTNTVDTTTVTATSRTTHLSSSPKPSISPSSSSKATTTTALNGVTKDSKGPQSDMLIVAAGGGAGGVVLIVICIIVIVCCVRNRSSRQKETHSGVNRASTVNYQYENNINVLSNENADDLPTNVLYHSLHLPEANLRLSEVAQSSEKYEGNVYDTADTNPQTNSHMYSSTSLNPVMSLSENNNANNKKDTEDADTTKGQQASIPLYAVPEKKKSKVIQSDNPECPVYAMPVKKKKTKSQEISNPNTKPAIAKKPSKQPKGHVNEDGLQYADLELNRDSREVPNESVTISSNSDVMYADLNM